MQEHFNPREQFQPSGPLFGVQFSQLACSDLMRAFDGVGPSVGPQRSRRSACRRTPAASLYIRVAPWWAASACWPTGSTPSTRTSPTATPMRRGDRLRRDIQLRRADRSARRPDHCGRQDVPLQRRRLQSVAQAIRVGPAFTIARGIGRRIDNRAGLLRRCDPRGNVVRPGCIGHPRGWRRQLPGRDAFVLVDAANALRYPPRRHGGAAQLGGAV